MKKIIITATLALSLNLLLNSDTKAFASCDMQYESWISAQDASAANPTNQSLINAANAAGNAYISCLQRQHARKG